VGGAGWGWDRVDGVGYGWGSVGGAWGGRGSMGLVGHGRGRWGGWDRVAWGRVGQHGCGWVGWGGIRGACNVILPTCSFDPKLTLTLTIVGRFQFTQSWLTWNQAAG